MRKLSLDLARLRVESFAAGGRGAARGTIRGNDGDSNFEPCAPDTVNCTPPGSGVATCASCAASCDWTCGGTTCAGTCYDPTCNRRDWTCDCVPQGPQ